MRIGSLFSGYGGLDLAVTEVLPTATPRWFVESDGAPSLRASRIGAPHHRERLFILAVPTNPDSVGLEAVRLPSRQPAQLPRDHNSDPPLPRADSPTHLLHLLNALDADQAELHTRLCWGHTGAAIRRWGQTLHLIHHQ